MAVYSFVPQSRIDPDEQWREARLRRVRDFLKEHLPSARLFVEGESKRLTPKRYRKSPLIIYTRRDGKREYLIPDEIFRSTVCGRMPWLGVLHTLMVNLFLSGGRGLIAKDCLPLCPTPTFR